MTSPINLTDAAIAELVRLRAQEAIPDDHILCVGVKSGGCSGLSYQLGFDQPTAEHERFEVGGIPVGMIPAHGMYLAGMEVDFHDGLNNRGFVFNNPNAADTCGCGTSFNSEA